MIHEDLLRHGTFKTKGQLEDTNSDTQVESRDVDESYHC